MRNLEPWPREHPTLQTWFSLVASVSTNSHVFPITAQQARHLVRNTGLFWHLSVHNATHSASRSSAIALCSVNTSVARNNITTTFNTTERGIVSYII